MRLSDESVRQVVVCQASAERCFAVATDFVRYPKWAKAVGSVEVLSRDGAGRGVEVAFRAAAFGRSTAYTLSYDYSLAPTELAWCQVEGDLTSELTGRYVFHPQADGSTEVTYEISASLKVPIPGFVKRRTEGRIVHTALSEFKAEVEGG